MCLCVCLYVLYSRPNRWTDRDQTWAGDLWQPGERHGQGQTPVATLEGGPYLVILDPECPFRGEGGPVGQKCMNPKMFGTPQNPQAGDLTSHLRGQGCQIFARTRFWQNHWTDQAQTWRGVPWQPWITYGEGHTLLATLTAHVSEFGPATAGAGA